MPEWLQKKQKALEDAERDRQRIHKEVDELRRMIQRDGPRFWKSLIKDLENSISAASKVLGASGTVSPVEAVEAGVEGVRVTATYGTSIAHVDVIWKPHGDVDDERRLKGPFHMNCYPSIGGTELFRFRKGNDGKLCVYTETGNGGGPGFKPGEYIVERLVEFVCGERKYIFR